jgi:hypothetical protein
VPKLRQHKISGEERISNTASTLKAKLLLLGPVGVAFWFIIKFFLCYFLGICVL